MTIKDTHIFSNTKIAIIGFLLILIPCIILIFLDYQAINKNKTTVRTNYEFTTDLIRDKIEQEVLKQEEKLSVGLNDLAAKLGSISNLKLWLTAAETNNPLIENSFILKQDGGIISNLISSQWNKNKIESSQVSKYALSDFTQAENIEFIEKDYTKAANIYTRSLNNANSKDSVLLINRIARCYFHNHDFDRAIKEYKHLLDFKSIDFTIASIPASVVALSQIAEVYNSTHQYGKRFIILLSLYDKLVDKPWDTNEEVYFYFLRSVSDEVQSNFEKYNFNNSLSRIFNNLKKKELNIYAQAHFNNTISKKVLQKIDFLLNNQIHDKTQLQHLQYQDNDSTLFIGYFFLHSLLQKSEPSVFGFQIKTGYILTNILPEIIKNIELGNNISPGIVNENDKLLYPNFKAGELHYITAKNFSQIFPSWKIVLFNREGKSLDQLIYKEKQQSFLLFGMTILVMLTGLIVIVITSRYEYKVSKMKSYFVSNVSHELKTPLSIIKMFSETLESGIVTDINKQHEFFSVIKRESERLTNLINHILDFSKIENRKKEFSFEAVNITQVVKNITDMYRLQLDVEGFMFEVKIPTKEIILNIDKDAVYQAILNLLTNAVKYSIEKKHISIELYETEKYISISITDNGIGIPKKELKNIFNNFYRVFSSKTIQIHGTGLGLTIAKYIIEEHGGSISVESKVNIGSKFTIKLPVIEKG